MQQPQIPQQLVACIIGSGHYYEIITIFRGCHLLVTELLYMGNPPDQRFIALQSGECGFLFTKESAVNRPSGNVTISTICFSQKRVRELQNKGLTMIVYFRGQLQLSAVAQSAGFWEGLLDTSFENMTNYLNIKKLRKDF